MACNLEAKITGQNSAPRGDLGFGDGDDRIREHQHWLESEITGADLVSEEMQLWRC